MSLQQQEIIKQYAICVEAGRESAAKYVVFCAKATLFVKLMRNMLRFIYFFCCLCAIYCVLNQKPWNIDRRRCIGQ